MTNIAEAPQGAAVAPKSGVLIAYYSLNGHARTLAQTLAGKLGADLVEIAERRPRRAGRARPGLRSRLDALLQRRPAIAKTDADIGRYALVLLAGPVLAGRVAGPLRSFVAKHRDAVGDWALLVTHDQPEVGPVAAEFARRIGRPPRVVLDMMRQEIDTQSFEMKLDVFAKTLAGS